MTTPNCNLNDFFICQVELKIESVKSRLDDSGQIKKNDFIEYSIEAKLLDLTDSSNARKTVEGTPKKNKGKEEWTKKLDTNAQVKIYHFFLIFFNNYCHKIV